MREKQEIIDSIIDLERSVNILSTDTNIITKNLSKSGKRIAESLLEANKGILRFDICYENRRHSSQAFLEQEFNKILIKGKLIRAVKNANMLRHKTGD